MPDLLDGESAEVQGSARLPYILKNVGGVYSCTCPAWRNQSAAIERRTCKHLRLYRGDVAESQRIALAVPTSPPSAVKHTAPPLLLAETWDGEQDVTGWWLSEKLDGVRAYWDGSRFLSRQGNPYHAPGWFRADLPSEPLDGELWLARKSFQRTVSIVRRQDEPELWRSIRFVLFDAPSHPGSFEERLEHCRRRFEHHPAPFLQVLPQQECRGAEHLRQELVQVERLGGEGLMLRQPGSLYEPRRSPTLLKVKQFFEAEARVLAHEPGAGRHRGRLGALVVELPCGLRFAVGSGFTDRERERPPAIGSTITFRYQELTERGCPRFPTFVRVRTDLEAPHKWQLQVQQPPSPQEFIMSRRFEFIAGSSAKFWEVTVAGADVIIRYGRLGTEGQSLSKSLGDADAARRHADKLVGEKLKKGYVETALR